MFVYLHNDRTFIVPIEKFPGIQHLTSEERKAIEIIDDKYLSFLSIDEFIALKS